MHFDAFKIVQINFKLLERDERETDSSQRNDAIQNRETQHRFKVPLLPLIRKVVLNGYRD